VYVGYSDGQVWKSNANDPAPYSSGIVYYEIALSGSGANAVFVSVSPTQFGQLFQSLAPPAGMETPRNGSGSFGPLLYERNGTFIGSYKNALGFSPIEFDFGANPMLRSALIGTPVAVWSAQNSARYYLVRETQFAPQTANYWVAHIDAGTLPVTGTFGPLPGFQLQAFPFGMTGANGTLYLSTQSGVISHPIP
jgi:hypothetical protein